MIRSISDLDGQRLRTDICVIGSGAAGLTLAAELLDTGLQVVVLAGGPEQIEAAAQDLYGTEVVGMPLAGAVQLRYRVLGGSTRRWAGQLLPFVAEDFAAREWVPHSGWPLSLADLAPYYTRAAHALGVPPFPEAGRPIRSPDFPALAASSCIDVLIGASVTELHADASGAIERARVRGPESEDAELEARTFVLCAGGLENARILLASEVGVEHDLVGRFFQEHGGIGLPFATCDARRLRELLGQRRSNGISRQPYLRASPELQRTKKLPGASAGIRFAQPKELVAGKELVRALRDPSRRAAAPRNLRTVVRRPGPLVRVAAGRFLAGRPAQDSLGTPSLMAATEQVPNPQSRVSLGGARDRLGVPRLVVDWRLTDLDATAWRVWIEVLAIELERAGLATVDLDATPPLDDAEALSGLLVDAGHHMGTTRMALRSEEGVVDPDCRVFGTENLFIVSSSVFPTGGTSNPTLTIIALAIRLADRVRGG